jgi:hypothetical protein
MTYKPLCSPAWRLVGIGNEPGILELTDGHLELIQEAGAVFRVPLSEVNNISFPWYYFNGGVKFTIGSEKYRISFIQPNDAFPLPPHLMERTQFGSGFCQAQQAGKAWKSVLAARMSLQK